MTIRALIFDFDGLILDTESPMRRSWMEIYQTVGITVSENQWASLLGASADLPEAYALLEKHLDKQVDRALLHEKRMSRELQLLEAETILPGVRELICDAQAAGLALAVASSSQHAWVEGLLKQHDLIEPFDVIVCAEDVAQTKPAPDLFLKALALLAINPEEAIVFEDSQHGIAAANKAAIFSVAVPNHVTRCLSFEEANLIVSSLCDRTLREYLEAAQSFASSDR